MTASLQLDQTVLDQVAKDLTPDVVYIRSNFAPDWSGNPAIYFRVVLSDDVNLSRLGEVTDRVSEHLERTFHPSQVDLLDYINYRTLSEQRELNDAEWR